MNETTNHTQADVETYQTLLRSKYDLEWTLNQAHSSFKTEPSPENMGKLVNVMAQWASLDQQLVVAAEKIGATYNLVGTRKNTKVTP